MQRVEVQKVIEAPVELVWERYTDHRSWTRWAGLGQVTLEREGTPAPNGVGCVRVFSRAGIQAAHEEVLSFEPPRRMTYRIVKGLFPVKDHLGEVLFEAHERGTLITWRCQFNAKIPALGGLFQLVITRIFRNALKGLAREYPR
jgi:uncharacterized protein YndB with AHSA1/START domain